MSAVRGDRLNGSVPSLQGKERKREGGSGEMCVCVCGGGGGGEQGTVGRGDTGGGKWGKRRRDTDIIMKRHNTAESSSNTQLPTFCQ